MEENDSGSSDDTTGVTSIPNPVDTEVDPLAVREMRKAQARENEQRGQAELAREVGAAALAGPLYGGGKRPRRLLLIGLDGAAPELALGAWRTELRTLHSLTERGVRARVQSSVPCSSALAWQSLLSGQDPGQLGLYGATRRINHSYAPPIALDSRALREPRLWDLLGKAGKQVGLVGVPATTPAIPVPGHLVGDQLVHGELAVYPPALRQQVTQWLEDDGPALFTMDDDLDVVVGKAYVRTEQRFRLARRLLSRNTYDCFVICDDGIATVQRTLWHTLDATHRRYVANHPFAGAISTFYHFVDDQIATLLELIDDDTMVAVVALGGAQALDGELALNDWLIAQGELVLNALPSQHSELADCDIAWDRTRVWAGDAGALYFNLAGREPQGIIHADQVEYVYASLRERLRALVVPEPMVAAGVARNAPAVEVYRPNRLYRAVRDIAPDLITVCNLPGWRTSTLVGRGSIWLSTLDTPMDAAYESARGLFILDDPRNVGAARELEAMSVYDILPTLLRLLEQPIPARLPGQAVLE